MSPILHALHWLPVESRIQYKIIILTFKSLNNQTPSYLTDFIQLYILSRELCSSVNTPILLSLQVFWSTRLLL